MRKYINIITEASHSSIDEGRFTNAAMGVAGVAAAATGGLVANSVHNEPNLGAAHAMTTPMTNKTANVKITNHNGRDFIYFTKGLVPSGTFKFNGKTYSVSSDSSGTPTQNLMTSIKDQYVFIGWKDLGQGGSAKVGNSIVHIKVVGNDAQVMHNDTSQERISITPNEKRIHVDTSASEQRTKVKPEGATRISVRPES